MAALSFNQMIDIVSKYVDQTNAIKNLDKKRKKGVPKLKEDKKKDDDGTVSLRRVESMDGKCYKCNEKSHSPETARPRWNVRPVTVTGTSLHFTETIPDRPGAGPGAGAGTWRQGAELGAEMEACPAG